MSRTDRGASLIFALIIVTVVSLVVTSVIAMSFTSSRTTVAMRDQAALTYAADGAAQVAINALRTDTFNGTSGQCVTTSSSITLRGFYPGVNGSAPTSAYVACSPAPGNGANSGATSANASPGSAVLTLGTGTGGEDGIYVTANAGPVKIRGGVFSNSTIDVGAGGITNTYDNPASAAYNLARGICTNQSLITPAAYTTCGYTAPDARGTDPALLTPHGASYDSPPAAPGDGTIGVCAPGAKYQTVTPGRFTSAAALNQLTGCATGIVLFLPGAYYFDFKDAGSHVWNVNHTYVIAGTPTIPLTATPTPAQMPGSCVPPASNAATTSSGALFVFGGDSQLALSHQGSPGGQVAICASRSASGPPIAVYGLKTALGGAWPVTAQTGCVTALPPTAVRCSMITTDQSPSTTLTIQGTTYTPRVQVTVNLNNSTNQVFRWGLITRTLYIGTTGSADLSLALIDVPDVAASPIPVPNIMYLTVYVCPGVNTCSAAATTARLRIKVQLSALPPRTVTVLSWGTLS
ncbi:MAG TPA: hypothetical protein VJ870_00880 [Amycolatopsis sp.]|nr:hypothetical protein [Amycolatopsis sp.]